MKLVGLCRLGRDAEVRYTSSNEPVAGFSAAFDYGRKGQDGRRPTQWVELTLWGKRAEALAQYLTKGQQVFVVAGDPHVETYEKRDGSPGWKLTARVDEIEFAGGRDRDEAAPPAAPAAAQTQLTPTPTPTPAGRPQQAAKPATAFDDMVDDIPF